MKNTMKRLFLVTLMSLVSLVNANANTTNEILAMKITGKRSFQISVKNVVGQAHLKIVDRQGSTLYTSDVDHNGSYSRKFDVSSLPSGTYFLAVEDEYKTKTIDVTISKELTLDLVREKTQLNPIITVFENKVTVSMDALEEEKMTIFFYDEASNQLEYHRLKGEGYIAQRFSLESLEAGTYKVLVNHRGKSFTKKITLQ